jgi:hypothetical protein
MTSPTPPPPSGDLGAILARSHLRILQEIMDDATAAYWDRRAADFEDARPRPGEWPGHATPAERATRDYDLAETARACRNRAAFIRRYGDQAMAEALTDHIRDQLIEQWTGAERRGPQ